MIQKSRVRFLGLALGTLIAPVGAWAGAVSNLKVSPDPAAVNSDVSIHFDLAGSPCGFRIGWGDGAATGPLGFVQGSPSLAGNGTVDLSHKYTSKGVHSITVVGKKKGNKPPCEGQLLYKVSVGVPKVSLGVSKKVDPSLDVPRRAIQKPGLPDPGPMRKKRPTRR